MADKFEGDLEDLNPAWLKPVASEKLEDEKEEVRNARERKAFEEALENAKKAIAGSAVTYAPFVQTAQPVWVDFTTTATTTGTTTFGGGNTNVTYNINDAHPATYITGYQANAMNAFVTQDDDAENDDGDDGDDDVEDAGDETYGQEAP